LLTQLRVQEDKPSKPGPRSPAAGDGHDRRTSLLVHQAVAQSTTAQTTQDLMRQGAEALSDMTSPSTSPIGSPRSSLPQVIIIPGPGAADCGPEGTLYEYRIFPSPLRKEWMVIPQEALHPVLVEIMSRRKKYMKKGHRMILARSVEECMKDWQVGSISQSTVVLEGSC
jgi:hypothetical protein